MRDSSEATIGVVTGFVLLALGCAMGQQTAEEIMIEVNNASAQSTGSAKGYVSGYQSTMQGQTIEYHSSDVDLALLARW